MFRQLAARPMIVLPAPPANRSVLSLQTKADITIESGQHDPETLLDLAIATLAVVMDRQPGLNKASVLLAKVCCVAHTRGEGRVGGGGVLDTHAWP